MDYEMFVGEQRYVENFIRDFMEYYKKSLNVEEDDYAKTQAYVKGMKAKLKVDINKDYKEDDPDAEENKKFDREAASSSSSEEEEPPEEEEEDDDDSDEDGSDDDEDDSEEDDHGRSNLTDPKNFLGLSSNLKSTAVPSQNTPITINSQKVRVKTPDTNKKPQTLNIPVVDSADNSDEDDEDEEEEEDEEEKRPDPKKLDKYRYRDTGSNASPAHSHRSDMPLTNSPSSRSKLIEKNSSSNNRMTKDEPSLFGRSRIGNNSTMKLDFDDDEEAEMKYRL